MAATVLFPLHDAAGALFGRARAAASQPVAATVRQVGHSSTSRLNAEASIVGKASSVKLVGGRRGFLSQAASGDGETAVDVAVQDVAKQVPIGAEVETGVVPSGEWAHNFSIQTYEDLSVHLVSTLADGEEAASKVVSEAASEQSPILPDSSHGVVSGEWGHNFSIQTYEDLHQHFTVAAEREAARIAESPLLPDKSHGVLSGEWGHNFSIQTYEDLHEHFSENVFKKGAEPDTIIADIMVRQVRAVSPSDSLAGVLHHLENVTGVPVVDADLKCVGLLSKKDIEEGKDPSSVLVSDVMTSPAITLTPDKSVKDAVIEMLKNKIHRVPVVNEDGQLVGIVTRTDIFTALEAPSEAA